LQAPVLQFSSPESGQVLNDGSHACSVKLQPFGPEMPPTTLFIDEKVSARSVSRLNESFFVVFFMVPPFPCLSSCWVSFIGTPLQAKQPPDHVLPDEIHWRIEPGCDLLAQHQRSLGEGNRESAPSRRNLVYAARVRPGSTPDDERDVPVSTVAASNAPAGLRLYATGEHAATSYPLPASGTLTLGRGADCDITIDDTSVSRLHAVLHIAAVLEIEDRGSHNGTWIGERRLADGQRRAVLPGEVIHLGTATVVVYDPAPPRSRHLWPHGYFEILVAQECARAAATRRPFAVLRVQSSELTAADVVVDAMSRALRDIDVLGSYGPDDHEALLVEVEPAQARELADQIAEALRARGAVPRLGLACFPLDGTDPASLMARAGAALRDDVRDRPLRASVPAIEQVRAVMQRVANTTIAVLILGETGVGKEVMARALHASSRRAEKPFVPIHCAALSPALFESELFGHEKGAFTSALAAKPGLLETADGGTVFFDEIGELPEAIQVKLLRVLEDRVVVRVGGTRAIKLDVRFVAATHRDLEAEVARGAFRSDLYFRLSGVTLVVPPMRHRIAEIEELARAFCEDAAARLGRPPPVLSPDALAALEGYSWPGNIRELRNMIERATVLCDGSSIEADDLPLDKMAATLPLPAGRAPPARVRVDDEAEKARIVAALAQCNGNQTRAASLLGYSLRKLVYLMTRYELPRPRKRRSAP
jgi:two-component system, NtrC family, response regulator AtoC